MPPRSTKGPRLPALLLLALPLLLSLAAARPAPAAPRELAQVFVAEPYLELRTGPGRGFPVTQVVARGESVDVVVRRTDWFLVRTERGYEGWVRESDMQLTRLADGTPFSFDRGDREGFREHAWEGGVMAGAYGGASTIDAFAARSLTEHLKIELSAGNFLGNRSNGYIVDAGLAHVFMPQWRFSPFVTMGVGYERSVPKATLVQPVSQNLQSAYEGLGGRFYLARRFYLRGEYRHHTVITHTDSNEVKQEWKLGFAFFY